MAGVGSALGAGELGVRLFDAVAALDGPVARGAHGLGLEDLGALVALELPSGRAGLGGLLVRGDKLDALVAHGLVAVLALAVSGLLLNAETIFGLPAVGAGRHFGLLVDAGATLLMPALRALEMAVETAPAVVLALSPPVVGALGALAELNHSLHAVVAAEGEGRGARRLRHLATHAVVALADEVLGAHGLALVAHAAVLGALESVLALHLSGVHNGAARDTVEGVLLGSLGAGERGAALDLHALAVGGVLVMVGAGTDGHLVGHAVVAHLRSAGGALLVHGGALHAHLTLALKLGRAGTARLLNQVANTDASSGAAEVLGALQGALHLDNAQVAGQSVAFLAHRAALVANAAGGRGAC
mmetsp:Transcript_13783/g.31969  ORF Transcript_13783/g.31969 Transcript_13783/m.31969 type:complete len:359 (+) Transcript_13783:1293-2369(+)